MKTLYIGKCMLFPLTFVDIIKEGDGERVLRCWRYLLQIYKGSGRTNYSIEALHLLCCQHHFYLTPSQSSEIIWSHFVKLIQVGYRGKWVTVGSGLPWEEIFLSICTKST